MHFALKLVKNTPVMVESVSEKAVQSSDNLEQMLGWRGGNIDSRVEIVAILNHAGRVVQRVDHIVDGGALFGARVGSAHVEPRVVGGHLWTALSCAHAEQLNN